ncbi:MAG TPA: hypothetical protein DDX19_10660 [Rhodopirellula baltica]|nr:hypothetical protein [Rhodopirellula baltica]
MIVQGRSNVGQVSPGNQADALEQSEAVWPAFSSPHGFGQQPCQVEPGLQRLMLETNDTMLSRN